jgi:hypothetical protein
MSEQRTEQNTAPAVEELPQSRVILVICRNRELERFKREFEQWQSAGYCLLSSDMTTKRFDGYLFVAWREKPVPRGFLDKLARDLAIFDYIPIHLIATTT